MALSRASSSRLGDGGGESQERRPRIPQSRQEYVLGRRGKWSDEAAANNGQMFITRGGHPGFGNGGDLVTARSGTFLHCNVQGGSSELFGTQGSGDSALQQVMGPRGVMDRRATVFVEGGRQVGSRRRRLHLASSSGGELLRGNFNNEASTRGFRGREGALATQYHHPAGEEDKEAGADYRTELSTPPPLALGELSKRKFATRFRKPDLTADFSASPHSPHGDQSPVGREFGRSERNASIPTSQRSRGFSSTYRPASPTESNDSSLTADLQGGARRRALQNAPHTTTGSIRPSGESTRTGRALRGHCDYYRDDNYDGRHHDHHRGVSDIFDAADLRGCVHHPSDAEIHRHAQHGVRGGLSSWQQRIDESSHGSISGTRGRGGGNYDGVSFVYARRRKPTTSGLPTDAGLHLHHRYEDGELSDTLTSPRLLGSGNDADDDDDDDELRRPSARSSVGEGGPESAEPRSSVGGVAGGINFEEGEEEEEEGDGQSTAGSARGYAGSSPDVGGDPSTAVGERDTGEHHSQRHKEKKEENETVIVQRENVAMQRKLVISQSVMKKMGQSVGVTKIQVLDTSSSLTSSEGNDAERDRSDGVPMFVLKHRGPPSKGAADVNVQRNVILACVLVDVECPLEMKIPKSTITSVWQKDIDHKYMQKVTKMVRRNGFLRDEISVAWWKVVAPGGVLIQNHLSGKLRFRQSPEKTWLSAIKTLREALTFAAKPPPSFLSPNMDYPISIPPPEAERLGPQPHEVTIAPENIRDAVEGFPDSWAALDGICPRSTSIIAVEQGLRGSPFHIRYSVTATAQGIICVNVSRHELYSRQDRAFLVAHLESPPLEDYSAASVYLAYMRARYFAMRLCLIHKKSRAIGGGGATEQHPSLSLLQSSNGGGGSQCTYAIEPLYSETASVGSRKHGSVYCYSGDISTASASIPGECGTPRPSRIAGRLSETLSSAASSSGRLGPSFATPRTRRQNQTTPPKREPTASSRGSFHRRTTSATTDFVNINAAVGANRTSLTRDPSRDVDGSHSPRKDSTAPSRGAAYDRSGTTQAVVDRHSTPTRSLGGTRRDVLTPSRHRPMTSTTSGSVGQRRAATPGSVFRQEVSPLTSVRDFAPKAERRGSRSCSQTASTAGRAPPDRRSAGGTAAVVKRGGTGRREASGSRDAGGTSRNFAAPTLTSQATGRGTSVSTRRK